MKPQIDQEWDAILHEEFEKPYIQALFNFLSNERNKHQVFPPESKLFDAFKRTPFDKVKVVIIGQDPYHQLGQANGLAFSVGGDTRIPPSLRNIYKELSTDIDGFRIPTHGDLSHWAEQGVLLLNTTLSVRESSAGSHQKKGWEELTDEIIRKISNTKTGIVFILWGKFAQSKTALIDEIKHHILRSAHPSPLSAYAGFFGSKPFTKTNMLLKKEGKEPIDWTIA